MSSSFMRFVVAAVAIVAAPTAVMVATIKQLPAVQHTLPVTKPANSALVTNGRHIPKVTLYLRRAGGSGVPK